SRGRDLFASVGSHLLEIELLQNATDRFRTDRGREGILAELILSAEIFLFGQALAVLQRRKTRIHHDVGFEVENALKVLQRHVEQKADPARQRLEEPDMRNRSREFDVAHAVAPNARKRHL